MRKGLLRSIAVGIGAGLAVGIGSRLAARQSRRPTSNLNPILDRLEDIESRVKRVELTPSVGPPPAPEEIEALGTIVSFQSENIASLRQDILRIERRNAEQVEAFGQKVALLEQQVPVHIEASVSAKMAELEHRLRGEFNEIHYRTVDAFAETIEKRVVGRITALENSLIEQSHSIVSLKEKSFRTDDNLNRLLDAVEKLCARAETQSNIALLQPEMRVSPPEAPAASHPSTAPALPPQVHVETQRQWQPPEESAPPPPPETVTPKIEPEPEVAFAVNGGSARKPEGSSRSGFKPVGMAILGLAILGFRLIR